MLQEPRANLVEKLLKNLANDDTGKHTHVIEEKCIITECPSKFCPSLCDKANGFTVKGHNTHKPPIGRLTRFISEGDLKYNTLCQPIIEKQQPNRNVNNMGKILA